MGLLIAATGPYSLFPPCITCMANREVIGIITKIDEPHANIARARHWLELTAAGKSSPFVRKQGKELRN